MAAITVTVEATIGSTIRRDDVSGAPSDAEQKPPAEPRAGPSARAGWRTRQATIAARSRR